MDILEKIFGSAEKGRMMRLFVFNPGTGFTLKDVCDRSKVRPAEAKHEIRILESLDLVKRKVVVKIIPVGGKKKEGEKQEEKTIKENGWILNEKFAHLGALRTFLINVAPLKHEDLARTIGRVGKIKLIITAGVFIQDPDSRLDLLVVGENIRNGSLERAIKSIEAEIGNELRYSVFDTEDFQYRLGMCDKLVRDVLDFPHEKVLDRLGVEE